MINAGKQNAQIYIYQAEDESDEAGGAINTPPVLYWSTKAHVKQLTSVKTQQAQQDRLTNGFTFSVRYRPDKTVAVDMFIVFAGNRYVITGVENVGMRNKELLFTAMESKPLI